MEKNSTSSLFTVAHCRAISGALINGGTDDLFEHDMEATY